MLVQSSPLGLIFNVSPEGTRLSHLVLDLATVLLKKKAKMGTLSLFMLCKLHHLLSSSCSDTDGFTVPVSQPMDVRWEWS